MGMELQLRQGNFGACSDQTAELGHVMDYEKNKNIIGAYSIKKTNEDRMWGREDPSIQGTKRKVSTSWKLEWKRM